MSKFDTGVLFSVSAVLFAMGACTVNMAHLRQIKPQEVVDHGCAHYDEKTAKFTWNGEIK